jgi:hypothetical protein
MRLLVICLLAFSVFAAPRTVIEKTVKPDTIMKIDTSYFVRYDTTKTTLVLKDSALTVSKKDTLVKGNSLVKVKK